MDNFSTSQSAFTENKFKFGKKWFWIGIVVGFLNVAAGIIYGLALIIEKEYRKEGLFIVVWAIIWALISFFVFGPWLVKSGLIPKF